MDANVQKYRVAIPQDVDRDDHVKYCLRSQTTSLIDANGMFVNNCPIVSSFGGITGGIMGALEFPKGSESLGSEVLAIVPYEYTIPIVVGVFRSRNSNFFLEKEKTMKIEFSSDTGSYHLSGDGTEGLFNLFVESNDGGGKVNISAFNSDKSAEIKLSSDLLTMIGQEQVQIRSNSKLLLEVIKKTDVNTKAQILYELATGLDIIDEFGNYIKTRSDLVEMDAGRTIKVGANATSPIAKGDIVEQVFGQVLDLLKAETVPTMLGPQKLILSQVAGTAIKNVAKQIPASKGKVE